MVPKDSLFRDDVFETTCRRVQDRNESRIIRSHYPVPCTISLQNMSSLENTHNTDIISQFIADLRPGDPLESGEEFLQYVLDRLEVRPGCEPASTGLAVPSGEVFDKHVARGRAVLL
jgi:hypothetical protein